ncbi:MAG TPA: S8 family serine peptidase [Candidatus Limnocylindrales bacterium]
MTNENPFSFRRRVLLALIGALVLLAGLFPSATLADVVASQRYIVVFKGDYALDGSYALGKGYALVTEQATYALDSTYALGTEYALYALNRTYTLLDQYALSDEYALMGNYALFGQYALNSGYALARDYALGAGYALAQATAGYALDSSYALLDSTAGDYLRDGYALLDAYALDQNYALARDYALYALSMAGGTITSDLSRQIGVFIVDSRNAQFAQIMKSYALVQYVGKDFGVDMFPSYAEAIGSAQLEVWDSERADQPAAGEDPLEPAQWDMELIRSQAAHAYTTGRKVDVGVLDSGIDGNHNDFRDNGLPTGHSNVDCVRGADFTFEGPGIGSPLACVDNNFHGTHVAGTIGARRNGIGVVGVAPNATLVPIKVCDGDGHCYVSDAVEGITYAGDLGLDVVNMSFFVDDDAFQESTEFKCQSNDTQRAYRMAVERALAYARDEGVSLVAALGNSDIDLANDAARGGKDCRTVPAQSPGVIGTVALGPLSEKSWYSSYGSGWADVSAPGGNEEAADANCLTEILSTLPGNSYGCIQGTSMASPHTVGVVALIIGKYGKPDGNGGFKWAPDSVWSKLKATAIDVGKKGYDKCYGYGRIDALRAARNLTSYSRDMSQTSCSEYT